MAYLHAIICQINGLSKICIDHLFVLNRTTIEVCGDMKLFSTEFALSGNTIVFNHTFMVNEGKEIVYKESSSQQEYNHDKIASFYCQVS